MVVLVTGGQGQLGQALQSIAPNFPDIRFYFAGSLEADITDTAKLEKLFSKMNPDFCINAAAYTAVDRSETEPEKATLINVDGARNLAETCLLHNATLIHVSTDFVFDGCKNSPYREDDPTNPQGVYGQTKLAGEKAIEEIGGKYFIVRTAWLYSPFGQNFMKTMLRLAGERNSLNVVQDQIGTPTNALDLAQAILAIVNSRSSAYGIYHYSNEGAASWYEFARAIFDNNDIKIDLKPIATSEFPTPAKRPKYSVLDKSKIKATFGIEIPDWRESLDKIQ